MKLFCDLDGTLLDVSIRHYKIYDEVTRAFGGTPLPKEAYWDLKRSKATWPEILLKSGLPAEQVEEYLDAFRKKIEDPAYLKLDQPFPGALEAIAQCAKSHDCYLVSLRRKSENLRAELEWLGIAPCFKEILTGHSETDGIDVKVPLIQKVLAGGTGAIIGDTETDIKTGKQLGLITIAVTSGLRKKEYLEALHPDHVIETMADAPALLNC